MERTRPRQARGSTTRRIVGGALALALGAAGAVAIASPAQADTTVTGGSLHWGFKQSFRNYVGSQTAALPPIGALPIADRITLTAPATFDPATPAVPTTVDEAKRPYIFAADSGAVNSASNVEIVAKGGVSFNFPSHYFQIQIANPTLKVSGSTATIYADTVYDVTQDFGDFTAGHYVNTQIPIATSSSVTVNVAGNGQSASVSATGVTLTSQGAAAVPLYAAGDPLDDFTASVTLEDPVTPAEPDGHVTVSKTTVDPAGDTVTVTGTGFLPTVLGTRPPLAGKAAGVYVVFGRFADNWKPSAGAASSARVGLPAGQGGTKWAVLAADMTTVGGASAGAIELHPDGTFTAQVSVKEDWSPATTPTTGNWGIYTYAGSGAASAAYETFTPITFATTPPPADNEQTITATVPQATPGGDFTWTIDSNSVVDLGTLTNAGAYYHATGQINTVTVTDTRTGQANSWSVSGQLSDFTGGLSGSHLGWAPKVVTAGAGATAGAAVANSTDGGPGLAGSQTLGSATDGHSAGSGTLGADLDLKVPVTTPAGQITATLTLTALS